MNMAIFSLRSAASFRNQSALLYKAAVRHGWEVEERDIADRVVYPKERWERILVLGPLWPRYVFDCVRLAQPWIAHSFWLYGPVDGPYTMNITYFQVVQNAIKEQRIAVPSKFCAEMMAKNDIHPGMVVPHGLDPSDFQFDDSQKYGRLASLRAKYPGKTLFFSNLNPIHRKGFYHLARALEILNEKRPNGWIFILHTGRDKAVQLAPQLASLPNLIIEDQYNTLPFREISLKTKSCDVFVFPSLLEGFGLPVLEAMFAKVPIVMADAPAHNELVDHKSAWLVPITRVKEEKWEAPGCMAQLHDYDPAALASAMEYAMDNPEESRQKAEAAFKRSKAYHYQRVYEPFVKR